MIPEKLEQRRLSTSRVQRNLLGLTENIEGLSVNQNYLFGLEVEEFSSGMKALAQSFKSMYIGMINEPNAYAIKNDSDTKGLVKIMNFLFLLAQKGILNNGLLEIAGIEFALALKDAKVTKPEIYFRIFESLGFITSGLSHKIETSDMITVEFPDNHYLLTVIKAMADAVGMFSKITPNRINVYFELLDYRVLENYPATEPKLSMEYILSRLKNESREVAEKFDSFLKPFAKCKIKGGIGWYMTPTFTSKSTKKVIMSLKLDFESHDVKLNLANIDKYTEVLSDFPEKMINEIKYGGWDCSKCNPQCERAFMFILDGVSYRKCHCGSFVFTEPSIADSKLLLELLKKEHEFS